MKVEDAEKWVEALRSGKYKQCQRRLRKEGGFCCLGVLDEIFPSLNLSYGSMHALKNYEKIGLSSAGGYLKDVSLFRLNDHGLTPDTTDIEELQGRPFTFDEIADVIQLKYVHKAF